MFAEIKHHGAGADLDGAEKAEKITAANPPSKGKEKNITPVMPPRNGAGRITSMKSLQNSVEKTGENYSVVTVTEPSTWDRKKGVQL